MFKAFFVFKKEKKTMDIETYKGLLKEMLDEDETMKYGQPEEVIYQIDELTVYGGYDCGIRGVDHNVLLEDGVEWRNVLEWGTLVVPETRTYASNTELEHFENLGYERVSLSENHKYYYAEEQTECEELEM